MKRMIYLFKFWYEKHKQRSNNGGCPCNMEGDIVGLHVVIHKTWKKKRKKEKTEIGKKVIFLLVFLSFYCLLLQHLGPF